MGDFNFYRSLQNRNKPGGCMSDTLIFNEAIGHLGLIELQLKGRAFTWSNAQHDPLLEQLDWFFTSVSWTIDYPSIEVIPMAKITSDHIPCKITIGTNIPCSNIFRFENFWADHACFLDTVHNHWITSPSASSATRTIPMKFKGLRSVLKSWSKSLLDLSLFIANCNKVILFLDNLDDRRALFNPECNLRFLVKRQLAMLLRYKNEYWKRCWSIIKLN